MSRTALVTGGSGGIGQAIVAALGAAGHRVAVGYAGNDEGARQAAKMADDAAVLRIDVADPESVDAAFTEVESALGPVELLVNNAGVNRDGLVMRMSDDDWSAVLRTNLDGAFYTIRRAVPKMVRARFGRIVNVGSTAGSTGSPGQANYSATKAGLIGLSRSVARELGSRGITCNVVAPGPITTPMTDALPEARRQQLSDATALGRFGAPEEVGAAVAFLCSELAGYITGAVVPVDGGLAMGH